MTSGLVADIGGTHARLALVSDSHGAKDGKSHHRVETVYECRGLDGVHELLDQYREHAGGKFPKSACIAVAGPIHGDVVNLTNLDWHFSIDALRSQYGFDRLEVINDLQATASGLGDLGGAELKLLKPGKAAPGGTCAVIGVGTGLGMSAAIMDGDRRVAMASEGGHVPMVPADNAQAEILAIVERQVGFVSAETVLSGAGLVRLHQALAHVHGRNSPAVSPESITEAALGGDAMACKTVELFCRLLARFASNTAMTFCATGGVYLTGQLLRAMAPTLAGSHFVERFATRGAMKELLEAMPVHLITASQPGLIGARARLAMEHEADRDR